MVTPREAGPGSPVSCVVAFEGNNCDLSEADQTLFKSFFVERLTTFMKDPDEIKHNSLDKKLNDQS